MVYQTLPGQFSRGGRWSRAEVHVKQSLWQHRFWEHALRDQSDFSRHMDYIHYNPVKHGYVRAVREWPHSSFDSCVRAGICSLDWGAGEMDFGDIGGE